MLLATAENLLLDQRCWLNVGCFGELEPGFAWAVCILAGAVPRMCKRFLWCVGIIPLYTLFPSLYSTH